jgi:hypothetical protein
MSIAASGRMKLLFFQRPLFKSSKQKTTLLKSGCPKWLVLSRTIYVFLIFFLKKSSL